MSRGWHFVSGDWNAICDRCGQKLKASKLKREWTGLMVCSPCFEHRHPMDFLRAKPDRIRVPWSRPISDTPVERTDLVQVNANNFNSNSLN